MMKLLNSNSIVGFVVGSAVCLTACLSIGSSDSEKVKDQRPVVSSVTMSPDIPSSVSFCGKDIDLTRYNMHEGFDRELSSFTYFHSTTMLLIKRANRCFPIIEPILKANGIPDDFKYLAVIESHLDPRVSSPARAVGTWQLLEGTARQYGLTITSTVDERCDVTKATEAACRYLKAAYEKYGDWAMVASVSNATGECEAVSNSIEIKIAESELQIPNAFSPGTTPGINDEFRVAYKSLVTYKCWIFNRWGVQMYHSTNPAEGWDGKKGGKYVAPGVYFYVIDAVGSDGIKYNKKGSINILRPKKIDDEIIEQ